MCASRAIRHGEVEVNRCVVRHRDLHLSDGEVLLLTARDRGCAATPSFWKTALDAFWLEAARTGQEPALALSSELTLA